MKATNSINRFAIAVSVSRTCDSVDQRHCLSSRLAGSRVWQMPIAPLLHRVIDPRVVGLPGSIDEPDRFRTLMYDFPVSGKIMRPIILDLNVRYLHQLFEERPRAGAEIIDVSERTTGDSDKLLVVICTR
jgi:hypothetical protein